MGEEQADENTRVHTSSSPGREPNVGLYWKSLWEILFEEKKNPTHGGFPKKLQKHTRTKQDGSCSFRNVCRLCCLQGTSPGAAHITARNRSVSASNRIHVCWKVPRSLLWVPAAWQIGQVEHTTQARPTRHNPIYLAPSAARRRSGRFRRHDTRVRSAHVVAWSTNAEFVSFPRCF